MKLSESLKSLATLSGIKDDDTKLVTLLESTKNIEVDDTLAATLGSSLLTMDAAKNNATLKSHFTGQALSTVDAKIEHLITQYGLEEEDINELKLVKSSYDKLEKVTEKIAKLTEKKAGKSTGDSTKAVTKLEEEKKLLVKQIADDKLQYENNLAGFKSNFMLDNILASKNWTLPEKLSASEKTRMGKILLSEKLNELGVVLTLENDKLIPKTKENTLYYKQNQPISTENLVDQILIENGLVKVADAPKNGKTYVPPIRRENEHKEIKYIADPQMEAESERQRQLDMQL